MKRAAVVAVVASAVALATTASAQSSEPTLTPVSGAVFPDRAYVVGLPENAYIGATDVGVRENGTLMQNVSVTPARLAEEGSFGVVLAIDASDSMHGQPIKGALAAAKAFAAQRGANQEVAVVAFNSTAQTVLPFTTDAEKIDAALAEAPPLIHGTHIYDATELALTLLAEAKIAAGSVVLLSDGADTGSTASAEDVVAQARAGHARIFTVGLHGRAFQPEPLQTLAEGTDGAFSEATSVDQLETIFQALGGQLASEYLVQYRSPADPEQTVHVAVAVDGYEGVLESVYASPAGPAGHSGPFHHSFTEQFWASTAGMVATATAAALLAAFAAALLIKRPRRNLRARMSEFVSLALPSSEESKKTKESALARAEKPLEGAPWWIRFNEELEIAGIETRAAHLLIGTAVATLFAMWIVATISGSLLLGTVGLFVPFLVRGSVKRKLERKRRLFADQLPDNLQVLASALRAGHSLVGALSVVVEDCPEPSRSEFRRIISDEQLGIALDTAFMTVAQRMDNRDLEQVALVAALQRETGGNTAEVLDRVAETVRSRFELRRLVRTLTTQGRMSRWVVSLLPVGLLVLITAINPSYMEPLYTHPLGRILLAFAAVMVVAGSLVIKRIIDIKV
jgi:tight adherence protein B